MFDLTGRKALVTGATGGIGGAIASALREQGAAVALSGTREDALRAVAEELDGVPLPCDLSDREAARHLPARAQEALGGLDILVNNAGITRDGLALRMSDDDWDRVLEVNLGACFRLARGALRTMMRQRWGRIISISSVVGHTGNPGQANYAAAKAGLAGVTRSLALEVATRGITVNAVAPGLIETAMTARLQGSQREAMLSRVPVARIGTPRDVAVTVAFLASEEAAYVTGEILHVNGGMAML